MTKHEAMSVLNLAAWSEPRLSTMQIAMRMRVNEYEVYNFLARENGQLGLRLVDGLLRWQVNV